MHIRPYRLMTCCNGKGLVIGRGVMKYQNSSFELLKCTSCKSVKKETYPNMIERA